MTVASSSLAFTGKDTPIHCRQILDSDKDLVVRLLTEGFDRDRGFWEEGLGRLAAHPAPEGLPRYGYVLDFGGTLVGVLLLIFTNVPGAKTNSVRCNVACWYVKPEFRIHAPMLALRALRHRQATYINLTPAPHTVPTLMAQGYAALSKGRFYSFPSLQRRVVGARIFVADRCAGFPLNITPFEEEVMYSHAEFGCISLVCRLKGRDEPFVFSRRPIRFSRHRFAPFLPGALLIYCRRTEDFVACAGTLGRFLLKFGVISVVIHANGPIPELVGRYVEGSPTYYLGAEPPQLCDLAFSEFAIFGV